MDNGNLYLNGFQEAITHVVDYWDNLRKTILRLENEGQNTEKLTQQLKAVDDVIKALTNKRIELEEEY